MGALQIDDGLRTRIPSARRSFLVPVALHRHAQETLTREKRRCESRRKPMVPHFCVRINGSLRTRSLETSIASDSQEGLWITCLRSRRREESNRAVGRRRSMSIPGTKWSPTYANLARKRQGSFDGWCFRVSTWACCEGTYRGPGDLTIARSEGAGSTSAGAPAPSKVTAKTARLTHQLGPHAVMHAFLGAITPS
jgi:hypothetical protein